MVNIKINGKPIRVPEGTTILQAASQNGVIIPTLCYLKDINEVAACRMCVVEIVGNDRLSAACDTTCLEGMEIVTNSKRVMQARRSNMSLLLSQHDCQCLNCMRNGNCSLQSLAEDMHVLSNRYAPAPMANNWEPIYPIIRSNSKCVHCLRCINICDKIQGMNVWDLLGTGKRSYVGVREGKKLSEVNCTYCGQCVTHCPVGALTENDCTEMISAKIDDPDTVVIFQVAPAVRSAWADTFGMPDEMATEKRMAAAIRALGADYVFDTNFTADLTIMEEGNELLYKMAHPDEFVRPLFTSCCPGWVRFLKLEYPDMVQQLSTAKSPQQMFGAATKTWFAERTGIDANKIFCISVMPCTAKKYECSVPEVNDAGFGRDVDASITTRELGHLLRMRNVNVWALKEEEFDSPLGEGTGAAVIFGATGGVMEAALRTAAFVLEGHNPDPDAFKAVRGLDGRKELTVTAGGVTVKACVASGLRNARTVVEDIRAGRADYDFVEIMACPGGCAGGGGQPITDGCEQAGERGAKLYTIDKQNPVRFSHENRSVIKAYEEFFEKPLSHKAHELLHTDQTKWSL